MKRFFLTMLVCLPLAMFGQLTIKTGVGYGLGTQPLLLEQAYTTSSVENIYASFGGNVDFRLGAAMYLNDYLEVGADFGFQNGRSVFVDQLISDRNYVGKLISFHPALTFNVPTNNDLEPYARLGLLAGFPLLKVISGSEEDKYRGNIPVGYSGALGFNFPMSDTFSLFAELFYQSMIYKPGRIREFDGTTIRLKDETSLPVPENQRLRNQFFSYGAMGLGFGIKVRID